MINFCLGAIALTAALLGGYIIELHDGYTWEQFALIGIAGFLVGILTSKASTLDTIRGRVKS